MFASHNYEHESTWFSTFTQKNDWRDTSFTHMLLKGTEYGWIIHR